MQQRSAVVTSTLLIALFLASLASPAVMLTDEASKTRDSGEDSACVVCITEVMPNADGSDQGIFPQGEWVELLNTGADAVNLEGWTIVDIGGWTHPINATTWVGFAELATPFTIEAGAYAVIAENEIGTLRINNAGETLYLRDATDQSVHEVVTGQAGNGMAKIPDPSDSTAEYVDAEEPTPGLVNSAPVDSGGDGGSGGDDGSGGGDGNGDGDWQDAGTAPWDGEFDIRFTGIMPVEIPGRDNDWLEITNFGDEPANLTGWTIERIRPTTPWISKFGLFELDSGESVVLSDNPSNLLADGGITAIDGNSALNNMPWLVDSGGSLQLKAPDGTVVDALVYDGGDAEIDGWTGPAVSVPGDGSPGLILMRGDGCTAGADTDSAADWEQRWIRIGASTFCEGSEFGPHDGLAAKASFSPENGLADLLAWLGEASETLHIHVYEFLNADLTNALIEAEARGVEVTLLLEEGILDDSQTIENQRGHAQAVHDAGGTVLWMSDPTDISSPYPFIHSKVAVRDSESVWMSSGNWKYSSLPESGESGNREWSIFVDSSEFATEVLTRMAWDENANHLHIDAHSFLHSPASGWSLPSGSDTTPSASLDPDTTDISRIRLLTCPDDCVDGLLAEIGAAESRIRLSVQYLDLDWYWGFGAENPVLSALHEAAARGVRIELMLNAYYADHDDDIRDAVNLLNTEWNVTQGFDVNARLMATSDSIWKLHNKGMIVDDDTVLVGSMNWGSNSMLRNREMGVIVESEDLTAIYAAKFAEDWNRLDEHTDSDGDLLPDAWEVANGLDRNAAAVLGTAQSEQSLDPDEDGLNNLDEYLLGGDPHDPDTDDDCILDGEEPEFARSVMRAPSVSMNSNDVDENGVPDGAQFGCENGSGSVDPGNGGGEGGTGTGEGNGEGGEGNGEGGGIINVREDPLSTPGAKFLLGLTLIAAVSLAGAGLTMIRRPKILTEERLVDDSGYRFDDADSERAILKGTRFDEESEDTREWTEGRDDGVHGAIVLDGFAFEGLSRDEVQMRLDSGVTIEELRDEHGEDEA